MHTVYFSLGSNIGDRQENLQCAIDEIEKRIGRVVCQSDMIVTEPQDFSSSHKFLNMAICAETTLSAMEILDITQDIERKLGRKQKSVDGIYHDRTIDIDILLYDDSSISSTRLTIPHPRLTQRLFVLQPLAQIAPDLIVPGKKQTIAALLARIS